MNKKALDELERSCYVSLSMLGRGAPNGRVADRDMIRAALQTAYARGRADGSHARKRAVLNNCTTTKEKT